jgi:hypothetical protein
MDKCPIHPCGNEVLTFAAMNQPNAAWFKGVVRNFAIPEGRFIPDATSVWYIQDVQENAYISAKNNYTLLSSAFLMFIEFSFYPTQLLASLMQHRVSYMGLVDLFIIYQLTNAYVINQPVHPSQ